MIKLPIIVSILLLGSVRSQDPPKCGVCQSGNEALCVTETSYYYCFGGSKYGSEMQCPEGEICSTSNSICTPKTPDAVNVCGGPNADSCGKCATGKKYTCVGPTQAGRCINGEIAAVINCNADEICVAGAEPMSVCVPKCAADFFKYTATCGADIGFTTTTPPPRTTPQEIDRITVCQNDADQHKTLFFYAYADSTCQNAVYCQRNSLTSMDWLTIYRPCPASTPYFDLLIRDCVKTKPASCLKITTTTAVPTTTPVTTTTNPASTVETTPSPVTTTTNPASTVETTPSPVSTTTNPASTVETSPSPVSTTTNPASTVETSPSPMTTTTNPASTVETTPDPMTTTTNPASTVETTPDPMTTTTNPASTVETTPSPETTTTVTQG